MGNRAYFSVFVQLSLNISLPIVFGEEGGSVSQSNIWGKVPARRPGSAVPLLRMEKEKEKGESVTVARKRPRAEAQGRTSPAGKKKQKTEKKKKKKGGIKTNKSREEEVRTEKELLSPRPGPGATAHPCNESSPSLSSGHVQALFWETEAGSAPAARRARASAGRSSRRRWLTERLLSRRGAGGTPACAGAGAREAEHQPRVVGLCRDKNQPPPQRDTPPSQPFPPPHALGTGC